MNPSELPLRDIHEQTAVAWWPLAPGWWLLLGAIVLMLVAGWFLRRFWIRRRARKAALQELKSIERRFAGHHDKVQLAGELSVLLRRACVAYYPNNWVAGLRGEAWLRFLDAIAGQTKFSEGAGRVLIEAPYRRQAEFDVQAVIEVCRHCIQRLKYAGKEPLA